jgi:hypothetical protein
LESYTIARIRNISKNPYIGSGKHLRSWGKGISQEIQETNLNNRVKQGNGALTGVNWVFWIVFHPFKYY